MNYRLLPVFFVLIILSGCSYHKRYQVKRLAQLTEEAAMYSETKENVTVRAKKFTSNDSKAFFYDVDLIKKHHIQPVQILLENNRSLPIAYTLCMRGSALLDSPCITYALHSSLLATFAFGGLMGWFMLPVASCVAFPLVIVGGMAGVQALIYTGIVAAGVILVTPFGIGLYRRSEVNKLIDMQVDLTNFLRKKQVFIGESVNGLVYYKTESTGALELRVFENNQLITTFDVVC